MLAKILKRFGIGFVVVCIITYVANDYIRISYNSDRSIGIVEQWLVGRPVEDLFLPQWSENYKHWDTASIESRRLVELIREYGVQRLTLDHELENQRLEAIHMSENAYRNASLIQLEYLEASNPDLPQKWTSHFVPAMDAWRRGFILKDQELLRTGTQHFNDFIIWMKLQKDDNFKPMR